MRSVWRGNNYHDKEKIPIDGADVPIFAPEKSKRVRSPNKYVEFTPTDIHKDIAQTTGKIFGPKITKFRSLRIANKHTHKFFDCSSIY